MNSERYTKLIIFQYQNNKNRDLIALLVSCENQIVNNILLKLNDAFDIEKATGNQLTIIGKYVGQSRYVDLTLEYKKFCYADLNVVQNDGKGYSTPDELTEGEYVTPEMLKKVATYIEDFQYRYLIKLKILRNNSDNRGKSYCELFKNVFNNQIIYFDNKDMSIDYLLLDIDSVLKKIIGENKYLLPSPAGVRLNIISHIEDKYIFGYSDNSEFINGYSLYNDLQVGVYLTKENIM